MNNTQRAFEKDRRYASRPSTSNSGFGDEHTYAPSQPLQDHYFPSSTSTASASVKYASYSTETAPYTIPHESFARNTSQTFEPRNATWRTEPLPQRNMDAFGRDGSYSQQAEPSFAQLEPNLYPPPMLGRQNDAFFGFSDIQQQPSIWPQEDSTLRDTPTISPQDLGLQQGQDYLQPPPSRSSENFMSFSDKSPSSPQQPSASPACMSASTPPKADKKSHTKPKGTRPTHNMIEKQYRMRLNAHFDELLAKIPREYIQNGLDLTSEGKPTSKAETLIMAEHYIKTLERGSESLSAENEELLSQFESLKAEWIGNGGLMLP